MPDDVRKMLRPLISGIKKDFWFFGGVGFLVGLLSVWQPRLKALGISNDPNWGSQLLNDFISINAFGLIFFVYLLLACAATIMSGIGLPSSRLERIVRHVERRMTQLSSSIIAFMLGLLVLVALVSIVNLDSSGARTIVVSVLLVGLVGAAFITATLVARRIEPFQKWWVASIILLLDLSLIGYMIIHSNPRQQ